VLFRIRFLDSLMPSPPSHLYLPLNRSSTSSSPIRAAPNSSRAVESFRPCSFDFSRNTVPPPLQLRYPSLTLFSQ
jgi:hypothetical protein